MTISAKLKHRRLTISAIFKCHKVTKSSNFEYMPFGWYLPTNGQWRYILSNLGDFTPPATGDYTEGISNTVRQNINAYITPCASYATTNVIEDNSGTSRHYWCSGEYNARHGRNVNFHRPNNTMYYCDWNDKTNTSSSSDIYYSRSVVTF